jgi:hypothetical protein
MLNYKNAEIVSRNIQGTCSQQHEIAQKERKL